MNVDYFVELTKFWSNSKKKLIPYRSLSYANICFERCKIISYSMKVKY